MIIYEYKYRQSKEGAILDLKKFFDDADTNTNMINQVKAELEQRLEYDQDAIPKWIQSINDCPDDASIYAKQIEDAREEIEKLNDMIKYCNDEIEHRSFKA